MGLVDIIKESGKRARGLALAGVLGFSGCLTTPQEAARLIVKPVLTGDFSDWDKPGQMSPQGNNASGGNGNYSITKSSSSRKNESEKIYSRDLNEMIKKTGKDGLYTALWIDIDKDSQIDIGSDSFTEVDSFYDGDRIFCMRKTPHGYISVSRIRDADNLFTIFVGEKVECNEEGAMYSFDMMPVEFIKRAYPEQKGTKRLYWELINERDNMVYASKEIILDFRN